MSRASGLAAGILLAILETCGPAPTHAQSSTERHNFVPAWDSLRAAVPSTTLGQDHWFDGFALPVIDGDVRVVLPWRDGIVIGGRFNQVGGIRTNNLAFWDGARWHSLAGGSDGSIECLCVYRGDLIVAGVFGEVGGVAAQNIARWDGSAWSPLEGGLTHQSGHPEVRALIVYEDALIAGGVFDRAGDTEALGTARWDGQAWQPFGESLDPVLSFAVFRDTLFAGRRTGPGAAGALELWNGSAWSPVDSATSGDRYVLALTAYRDRLIVAGRFDTLGTTPLHNIAAWDGSRWDSLGTGIPASVQALTVDQDTLVAGGSDGETWNLGLWDGLTWRDRSAVSSISAVQGLAVTPGSLWVGGYFLTTDLEGAPVATNFARVEGSRWESVGPWDASMNGLFAVWDYSIVDALAPDRNGIVAAGSFGYAGVPPRWEPRPLLARWDGEAWRELPELPPIAKVHSLLSWADTLIAGGEYLDSGSCSVARLDGDHWSRMDSLRIRVTSMARYHDQLYVTGESRSFELGPTAVYRWDGDHWTSLGAFQGEYPGASAMIVHDNRLIVAGVFTGIGTVSAHGLAAWDGVRWTPVASLPIPARVSALAVHEGRLVVGGSFANTSVLDCEGNVAQPLGAGFGEATSLASIQGHLFAGAHGGRQHMLEWDGTAWVPLEGGVNQDVRSLVAVNDHLYAGGAFTIAGSKSSFGIARWDGLAAGPDPSTITNLGTGVPNPFRNSATFACQLESEGQVRTSVLDIGGREITVLEDRWRVSGRHSIVWDGRDSHGARVRPGVYFVRTRMPGGSDRTWRVVRLQ